MKLCLKLFFQFSMQYFRKNTRTILTTDDWCIGILIKNKYLDILHWLSLKSLKCTWMSFFFPSFLHFFFFIPRCNIFRSLLCLENLRTAYILALFFYNMWAGLTMIQNVGERSHRYRCVLYLRSGRLAVWKVSNF